MLSKSRRKLGLAFSDELQKTAARSKVSKLKKADEWEDNFLPNYHPPSLEESVSSWRLVVIGMVFLLSFSGLFLRLFHLQVIYGSENRQIADSNRIQLKVLHAPRGVIYDRNGKVLAENNPGFRYKGEFLTRDEALELEAKNDSRFLELEVDNIRHYPYGIVASHALGYVGQVSEAELIEPQFSNYKMGDLTGRFGIEQVYEQILRGVDGSEIIEVDAEGKKLRTLRRVDPIPGKNVHLSLDIELQKVAFESLKTTIEKVGSCCGAAVAEDPKTGEVLLLTSYPSFDPNAFTDPHKNQEVAKYFSESTAPLLNRVISGTYPPGSTFKITSALAGLISGKVKADTVVEDTGVVYLGPYSFANWYFTQHGKKEGAVDLVKALQRSNDIYFYRVGEWVGEKILGETAFKVGLGKKLGIDLPGEVDGLIPSEEWKKQNIGEPWYPGDNLHLAIGQGFLLTTPLQILAQTAFVASDGELIQPHLATKVTNPDGSIVKQLNFEPLVKELFKKDDLKLVQRGLEAVTKAGGTAWPFFDFSIPTAGKTGTAEFGDPKNRTHAWYTSYAPAEDPQIVVTTLIEAGGEGSSVAAPVVKDIYTQYFY